MMLLFLVCSFGYHQSRTLNRLGRHWYPQEMARTSSKSPLACAFHISWIMSLVISCKDLYCHLILAFTLDYMPRHSPWQLIIYYSSLFLLKHIMNNIYCLFSCQHVLIFYPLVCRQHHLRWPGHRGDPTGSSVRERGQVTWVVCRWRSLTSSFPASACDTWGHLLPCLLDPSFGLLVILDSSYSTLYIFCDRTWVFGWSVWEYKLYMSFVFET